MVFSFLTKLFDSNEKEIQKYAPLIDEINALDSKVKKLKNTDFAKKTQDFKKRIKDGESLDSILPEAFALTREAAMRTTGQRHYDVQMMAAIALSHGKIAEQKTGEGKTLSAVPALYLHSLTGENVHLVTVNDYLARRDAGWMGPIFHMLGVTVSAIISEKSYVYDPEFTAQEVNDFRLLHLREVTRKEAYQADVVYGINSEFGFDYLRDNMAQSVDQLVQRGYYFAVVDEVDSVLIDEARTPHIISAPDEEPTEKYYQYAKLVEQLSADTDYKIDEKLRTAHLTDHGISKVEKMFGISDIYEKDFDTVYHLEAALKAKTLFHKEKDYIVKENEVILVDEFTGRLMVGRRLSEGLHQAIEAKENVPIQRESKTLATVSLQNYFRMYKTLAGMTGTAVTESEEFHKIYNLYVVVIPTYRDVRREDLTDAVYKTTRGKLAAVAAAVEEAHKKGQPVLVGTTSIEKNEIISQLLKRKGIKHEVLNAKNHEREAEIIANAGIKGAVTVATNMAGRGVDIILGGDTPKNEDGTPRLGTKEWKEWEKRHQDVLDAGGLYIIGTERHESRRIDNQLRGRAGRQGDPGTSQFYVALDDEIMRLFGGDTIANLMTRFNMPEDVPLSHPLVTRAIEQAQIKVEGFHFDSRKHLVDYDDVLNKQREIIYERRRRVLHAAEDRAAFSQEMQDKIAEGVAETVHLAMGMPSSDVSANEQIVQNFVTIIPFDDASQKQLALQLEQLKDVQDKISFLQNLAQEIYKKRAEEIGHDVFHQIEQYVNLSVIDRLWMDHLDAIENLRQGIGLRGYGQRDPLVEYKNEAFKMFEKLVSAIDDEVVHTVYKFQVQPTPQPMHIHQVENTPVEEVSEPFKKQKKQTNTEESQAGSSKKPGRNDPCWCGSGKKYKKCHYPN